VTAAGSVAEVVANGLCIGCGLCEAVTGGSVVMAPTASGSLRPSPADGFSEDEERAVLAACPGVVAEPRVEPGTPSDPVWGAYTSMRHAWAGDPDVRFRAATGGVLTALGTQLVESGTAAFVLHVGMVPGEGLRSRSVMSETAEEVLANTGSRYGPTAPLAGLGVALDRDEPFAVIAKPCDLGALHRFASVDARVDERCVMRLAMVCGGQSRLTKSESLVAEFGVSAEEVRLMRYRGHGNPGSTRIETHDGRVFEKTYLELWEDEASWDLEPHCLLCPDALGEAADIAAADVWPGGAPTGEDEGFNGIVVRSAAGERLVADAVEAGRLVLGGEITPRFLDDTQPHQVRKKERLAARYDALRSAGKPVIETIGLRIDELGARLDDETRAAEREGTLRRVAQGRWSS
jgi:coenzyme F420 hydrogenase subunit beta